MVDPRAARIWAYRLVWLAAAAALVFLRLLPLGFSTGAGAPPDLLLCLTAAFVLRRPEFVPAAMIVAVFLMVDLMFQRPPGLRALAVLLATEFLRRQAPAMRAATFAAEWATIAATFAAAALAERLVLVLFFVSRPGPGVALLELVMTVLAYPLVVVVTNLVFRVTKILPGESGLLGQRP